MKKERKRIAGEKENIRAGAASLPFFCHDIIARHDAAAAKLWLVGKKDIATTRKKEKREEGDVRHERK